MSELQLLAMAPQIAAMSLEEVEGKVARIYQEMDDLNENLSGCDWCCGGGDEAMEELYEELNLWTEVRDGKAGK